MKKIKYVFILLSFQSLFSQIFFDKIPIDKQLVARNLTTNQGTISIEGEARLVGLVNAIKEQQNQIDELMSIRKSTKI